MTRIYIKKGKPVDSIKLSILLPTVIERTEVFNVLYEELQKQAKGKPVELIVMCDNKEISIGAKRQQLLQKAKGEYIVFIDDDDWIAEDYIDQILANAKKDAIGFQIECIFDGTNKCLASASARYKDWAENVDGYRYVRSTYHKTPVKRELALKVGFGDKRFGEDYDYSKKLVRLVRSENYINKVMYYYRYKTEDFNKKYGIK